MHECEICGKQGSRMGNTKYGLLFLCGDCALVTSYVMGLLNDFVKKNIKYQKPKDFMQWCLKIMKERSKRLSAILHEYNDVDDDSKKVLENVIENMDIGIKIMNNKIVNFKD